MDIPLSNVVASESSPTSSSSDPGAESHTTLLHAASVNGDKTTLQALLKRGDGKDMLDCGDKFGRTPLVYSVLGDRPECVETLLKAGAAVRLCDIDGKSPIHWAACQGHFKCLKLLLSKANTLKTKDNEGRTPLHYASSQRTTKCLGLLLKNLKKTDCDIDEVDNEEMTSLHWSASNGTVEHVKMLIKAGAQVDIKDVRGRTPLHWAASNSDFHIIKLLLNKDSNILNLQDEEGHTVLHLAVAKQNYSVLEYLTSLHNSCMLDTQDNLRRTPLHWAAVLNNPSIVKLLVQGGADCRLVDTNGACALHYAAQNDCAETVKVLMAVSGVKDLMDKDGKTPAMWAAGKGAYNALKTLIEHNVDIHIHDKAGGTALHLAAYGGHLDCVMFLIDQGANVNSFDSLNYTPLFRACEMGHAEVVVALLEGHAEVDLTDKDGHTPLHWAALGGHDYIASLLIENDVTVDVTDKLGRTPLHCAANGGFVDCMSVLLENDADADARDHDGLCALHWACQGGYLEAVHLLLKFGVFTNYRERSDERLTPLDYAIMGGHQDVAQFMIEQGAGTIAGIQDLAATIIQATFRGYRVRKAFEDKKYKEYLMRHAQLRKEKRKADIKDGACSSPPPVQDQNAEGDDSDATELNRDRVDSVETALEDSDVNELRGRGDSEETTRTGSGSTEPIKERVDSVDTVGTEEKEEKEENNKYTEKTNDNYIVIEDLSDDLTSITTMGQESHQGKDSDYDNEDTNEVCDQAEEEEAARVIQGAWRRHKRRKNDERIQEVNDKCSELILEPNDGGQRSPEEEELPGMFLETIQNSISPDPFLYGNKPRVAKLMSRHLDGTSLTSSKPMHHKPRRPKPSHAALSYNFAMDQYHPMVSRLGISRSQNVQCFSQRVRPKSMKRTNKGWAHDRHVAKEMYGKYKGDIT